METDTDRRIFDSLESGMLWFDAELRIVDANRAALETMGLRERPSGARVGDLGWAPSDELGTFMAERERPVWRALHGNGETTSGIVVVHTPRGERWLRVRAVPIASVGAGRGRGAVVSFTDFTDEREATRSLEHRVADRTSELEAKHREMEAFTYSVSHDLKAPLRGIDGYSRLLESDHLDKLDEEGRFFVSMIRKATRHMGALIDDLLAYSRVERGRPKLGPVAPAQVVATVVDGAAAEAAAGAIALRSAVEPGLSVLGERDGLVLALRNLVDNAIKFTAGRPGRAIEIGARRDQDHVLFWVRDNGPGFDMRYHDRIFEIFQRLHRAEDYPGTGVGLAIVRKAVERMHGKVWAESTDGAGATFYIQLPALEQAPNM